MFQLACLLLVSSMTGSAASADQAPAPQGVPHVTLPPVVVTAQKEPADPQRLPVSVSAVNRETIDSAGIASINDASFLSPNTVFVDLSARKVSNPYIRGIGSSPWNPGVTTYIDGVPQLNANSANIELLDIQQIEFVRGPQSALFGRNAIGGLINVSSARPSLTQWSSRVDAPLGTQRERGVRAAMSGPLGGSSAIGLAFGTRARDGFTINDVTGNTLDDRSATFGRAQFLYMPTPRWETRFIVSGERDRDGDYALNDLDETRRNPFHAQRNVEGYTDRDIWSSTILIRHEGTHYAFSSVSGGVWWKTRDFTDLDYSAQPLMTRDNAEKDTQLTQEVRFASAAQAPVRLSSRFTMEWQTGVVLFLQHYEQDAVTAFAPQVLSPFVMVPVNQHSPEAVLDDTGVGIYALGTLTAWSELDLTLGARFDREQKKADLDTFYDPAIAPPTHMAGDRTFSDVSPQAALTWRATAAFSAYVSYGKGFKAGGFNTWAPAGSESYGQEHAWNLEAGAKMNMVGGRVSATAAYYRIDWEDMQLNVPTPGAPAQFYIANVGNARSTGFEAAVNARPVPGVDLYGTFGTTDATFGAGSVSSGVDVSGNELPNAPGYTASLGLKLSTGIGRSLGVYGRADVVFYGAYHYDDLNRAGQDAYSLVNLRGGFRAGKFGVEGWVSNVFDTRYVPVAFAYGSLMPSGFIGEPGHPRTVGLTARVGF
jgi:iron complex outermembrane recepter protein